MTREEAIEVIEQDIPCEYDKDLIEALDMAIKALDKCDRIEKIINSNDADFIANYVRGLFIE